MRETEPKDEKKKGKVEGLLQLLITVYGADNDFIKRIDVFMYCSQKG